MKISKKNLLEQLDMDEMAFKKKGVQAARTNPKTGELKPNKYTPYFAEGNETDIPDAWIININRIPGEDKGVVLLHGAQLDAFINENAALLDKLNGLVGGNLKIYEGNRTKWHPRNQKLGTQYIPSGEHYDEKEAILRVFNPILKNNLTDRVNEHLTKCGLSPINTYDNQAAVDKYSEISNYRITFGSHDYDFYNNVYDFAKAAKDLMLKGETSVNIYRTHMPRQYNPGTNWSALRKTEQMSTQYKNDPKTPVYALSKRGYEAEDKDVALSTTLFITGKLENTHPTDTTSTNKYTWTAKVTTSYGKKLQEEMRLNSGKFEKDKEFASETTVTFNDAKFDLNNPDYDSSRVNVMSVGEVAEGLREVLNDVANKILELQPRTELIKRVRVQQTDLSKRPNALNESEVISLIKNTLLDLNK